MCSNAGQSQKPSNANKLVWFAIEFCVCVDLDFFIGDISILFLIILEDPGHVHWLLLFCAKDRFFKKYFLKNLNKFFSFCRGFLLPMRFFSTILQTSFRF